MHGHDNKTICSMSLKFYPTLINHLDILGVLSDGLAPLFYLFVLLPLRWKNGTIMIGNIVTGIGNHSLCWAGAWIEIHSLNWAFDQGQEGWWRAWGDFWRHTCYLNDKKLLPKILFVGKPVYILYILKQVHSSKFENRYFYHWGNGPKYGWTLARGINPIGSHLTFRVCWLFVTLVRAKCVRPAEQLR